jgi:phosphohistidine phosphatase
VLIHLLRHGEACKIGGEISRDEERTLTPAGRAELERSLRAAAADLEPPERILHSPYVRARQSAKVLARVLGCRGNLEATDSLTPEADPHEILRELASVGRGTAIALVTHEPFAGRLLGLLLTGQPTAIPLSIGMLVTVKVDSAASMVGRLRFARRP